MKTKHTILFGLLCLFGITAFAQQNEPRVTITKRSIEADGSTVSETMVKKGQAARDFNIDQYLKDNKTETTDLDIRTENLDDERQISIKGSKGPCNSRRGNWEEDLENLGRDVEVEVERSVNMARNYSQNWNNNWDNNWTYNNGRDDNSAFLGVEQDSDEDSDEKGLTVEITRNSAAAKAGLRNNDVILKLNDTEVNRWNDLSKFIRSSKKGDKVKITYSRNGKETTTEAELTTQNDVNKANEEKDNEPQGFLGVSSMGDDDDDNNDNNKGARVSIIKKSAAEKAGLKKYDIIIQLNDTKIEDYEDIEDFMEDIKPGENIKIRYLRDGKEQSTETKAGEKQPWDWGSNDLKESEMQIRTKDACLGIFNGSAAVGNHRGASVVGFTEQSAAQMAGLQINDIILSINNDQVEDCDDLWNALLQYDPGDKICIDYVRNGSLGRLNVDLNACLEEKAYGQVTITDTDDQGNANERQYFAWNANEEDESELRKSQIITIRKAEFSDAPVIEPLNNNESNPVALTRTLSLKNLRVYPNPTSGQTTVEFTAEAQPTMVHLFDMNGRQLFQEELNAFGGKYLQQFDLTALGKGIIYLKVQQGDKVFTEQISIQ